MPALLPVCGEGRVRLPLHHCSWKRSAALLTAIILIYYVAAKLGLRLAFLHPSATPVWPPTGIALAALLLLGSWIWPAIFMGAFLVNLTTAGSAGTSLGIAAGNTLEGLLGYFLLTRVAGGRDVFTHVNGIFLFVGLAALASTMVSATVGVTSLAIGGYVDWNSYGAVWSTWWLGDATGALLVTPVIILWALPPHRYDGVLAMKTGLVCAVLALVGLVVFTGWPALVPSAYPLSFLVLPVLVWIAFWLGPRETATALLLLAVIAIWGTLHGHGPFISSNPNESLLLLQAFLGMIALTSLSLAAAVTEQRRAGLALEQLTQTLDQRVKERTLSLNTAVEELREHDRVKSALFSIVSHELRTPLTSIKGYVENMLDGLAGPLTEKQHLYLSRVKQNADRLTRRLNELLDLSTIEAGKQQLHVQRLPVTALIKDVLDEFHPMLQSKSLELDVCSGGALDVMADEMKLQQVVGNLLQNAIKFTQPGGRITVGCQAVDEDRVEISVTDNGPGIPADELPDIFSKFYRGKSVATDIAGAGLGLAIAKGLIELHGGTITVDSTVGKGTTMSITLPSARATSRPGTVKHDTGIAM
jgi:signal transduction histidine kinase